MPNEKNILELIETPQGAIKTCIDGKVEPGQVDLPTLNRSLGRSAQVRIWADRRAVVVDQVGNEVRWKIWEQGAWRVLWFNRRDYVVAIRRRVAEWQRVAKLTYCRQHGVIGWIHSSSQQN